MPLPQKTNELVLSKGLPFGYLFEFIREMKVSGEDIKTVRISKGFIAESQGITYRKTNYKLSDGSGRYYDREEKYSLSEFVESIETGLGHKVNVVRGDL